MGKRPKELHSRPPLQRMLCIHEALKRGEHPNCSRLKALLEMRAARTLLRDIAFMRDRLRLPIAYDRRRHGYYYSRPVEHFPGVSVSEVELYAMLVAHKALASYEGTPFHQPLRAALRRLAEQLGKETVLNLEGLDQLLDIRVVGPERLDEEAFLRVLRSAQQRRRLRFLYRKQAARQVERRHLDPYEVLCVNNRWYVIGHDPRRQAIRIFVLSRMRQLKVLEAKFVRPADFDIRKYLAGSFGIFKGNDDYEVVVELDRWAADILRGRRWAPNQEVVELPGGEMRVAFHLDSLEEIEQWVLSWGTHAMVVRPKALMDRVAGIAAGMVERYRGTNVSQAAPQQEELRPGLR